ncbi:Pre-mRNA-splicing factor of RES complex-domain-containing protein [Radiomyces spectabilis]|uniref:Pre-mRNA-splicing factor of RES complex-domain-containing protein n=1 Tax=Radiomyces spectabilis TaxID=64574 RepID=UPI00221F6857|nr:Pre-mRNA-splicing factor of RES complex-domain-containing protein [Radiomyces spectabilis]KAI8377883.1 Pre-mRNA-splicing factor of RES complex-domain-containing protein [Radiomyces spectabilis]
MQQRKRILLRNTSVAKKSGTSSVKKLRKGNLALVDEDELGFRRVVDESEMSRKRREKEEARMAAAAEEAEGVFRGRGDNWQTIQEGTQTTAKAVDEDEDEDEENLPVVVGEQGEEFNKGGSRGARELQEAIAVSEGRGRPRGDTVPKMSSGQKAGLLTSHEIRAEAERAREAERQMMNRLKQESHGKDAETIYRDVTGRKVDPKIKRAEEARAKKEAMEAEARKMEWGKGLVQRTEAEEEKRRLAEESSKPLARYADDEDYNQGLREQERWNDPAAGFLTKKPSKGKGKAFTRPTYQGAWKPNRFMIRPGYRWDGVDRSTGYEDQLLLQINQKKSRAAEAHAWSTEDM